MASTDNLVPGASIDQYLGDRAVFEGMRATVRGGREVVVVKVREDRLIDVRNLETGEIEDGWGAGSVVPIL